MILIHLWSTTNYNILQHRIGVFIRACSHRRCSYKMCFSSYFMFTCLPLSYPGLKLHVIKQKIAINILFISLYALFSSLSCAGSLSLFLSLKFNHAYRDRFCIGRDSLITLTFPFQQTSKKIIFHVSLPLASPLHAFPHSLRAARALGMLRYGKMAF